MKFLITNGIFLSITTEKLEILANEIAHIFKNEHPSTYFTPFLKTKNINVLASGKLWHHYTYVKDCLRKAELLQRKEVHKDDQLNVTRPTHITGMNSYDFSHLICFILFLSVS